MYQVFSLASGMTSSKVVATFHNREAAMRDAKSLNRQTESSRFHIRRAPSAEGWTSPSGWEKNEIVLENRAQVGYEALLEA